MRKQYAATVRTVTVPKALPKVRRLSLEEEALILDQANKDSCDVENGMSEVGRQLEISDALEDLAVVASNIRQASPTEIELIQTAGQMAVAGTDNEPELMLPAMESFGEGKSIAFEDMAQKAKTLWKNILEFVARLWEKIVAFFRVHVVVSEMRSKISSLRSAIQRGGFTLAGQAKTISEISENFMFEGKVINTMEEITRAMTSSATVAKFLYVDYIDEIRNVGGKVNQALQNFKPDNAEQLLTQLVSQLGGLEFGRMPGAVAEGTEGVYEVHTSQSFLGGGMLKAKTFKAPAGVHPAAALEGIRGSGITLERGDAKYMSHSELSSTGFAIPNNPRAMMNCLQSGETLLMVIEDFHKTRLGELKKLADSMKASSERAAQAFEAHTHDESGEGLQEFKAAVNMNAAFARWSQAPALPFYSQMIRACRGMLLLCQMAIQHGAHKQAE